MIEKLSECQKVCFVPRGSQMQDLTQPQHINTMLYEAELFATPVDEHLVDHPVAGGQSHHRQTADRDPPPDWGDFSGR